MPTVRIVVTQKDISEAPRQGWKFGHPCYGPVNNAICRILGLRMSVTRIGGVECPDGLGWYDKNGNRQYIKLPGKVMEIVTKFDQGETIAPFDFKLNFPS